MLTADDAIGELIKDLKAVRGETGRRLGVRRLDAALSLKRDQDQSGVKPPHSKAAPKNSNRLANLNVYKGVQLFGSQLH